MTVFLKGSFVVSLFLATCTAIFNFNTTSEPVYTNGRVSGIQSTGDVSFTLGGLFPVHSGDGSCSDKLLPRSIERIEAMLYAIDTINSDPSLLPDITFGYDIRDTCMSDNIALDECIDLLLTGNQISLDSCQGNTTEKDNLLGVIGAASSAVSVAVASVLRVFRVPQISYSSTSSTLNDRDRFDYFFRTIPPDDQQAQAMMDLILYFEWDYISTIHSNNVYGDPGIETLKRLAASNGICIDLDEGIDSSSSPEVYNQLAVKILNSTANAIVMFASIDDVVSLLSAIQSIQEANGINRKFAWIASDSWASSPQVTEYSSTVLGMWGTRPKSRFFEPFDRYLEQLTPNNNARNIWYNDTYIETYYNCSRVNCATLSPVGPNSTYTQDPVIPRVINAVYSVATALNDYLSDSCELPVVWYTSNQTCKGNDTSLTGEILLQYLKVVNFTSPTGNQVSFNQLGNINTSAYTIINYQADTSCNNCTGVYNFVEVGQWEEKNGLQFYPNITKQFGIDESGNILLEFPSQCQQCSPGYIKRQVISSCCGTCDPCLGQNYTNATTSTQCEVCPGNTWGNDPLSGSDGCVDIEESYLRPSDGWAITLMIVAGIGLVLTIFTAGVYIWFWNTPIVKSSGREQMVLILVAITISLLVTIFFILKPSPAVCGLNRIGFWFSLTLILSALLVKLIRITRIFLNQEISKRPKCITPVYQILFTFLFSSVQIVLLVISLIVVHPSVNKSRDPNADNSNDFPLLAVQCASSHEVVIVIQMIYLTLLLLTCNALAFLTIRFPANFNESKYVAIASFSAGLIWIAFVSSYFGTTAIFQNAVICFSMQLTSIATLLSLFGPRIFIMIVLPSKNKPTTTMLNAEKEKDANLKMLSFSQLKQSEEKV